MYADPTDLEEENVDPNSEDDDDDDGADDYPDYYDQGGEEDGGLDVSRFRGSKEDKKKAKAKYAARYAADTPMSMFDMLDLNMDGTRAEPVRRPAIPMLPQHYNGPVSDLFQDQNQFRPQQPTADDKKHMRFLGNDGPRLPDEDGKTHQSRRETAQDRYKRHLQEKHHGSSIVVKDNRIRDDEKCSDCRELDQMILHETKNAHREGHGVEPTNLRKDKYLAQQEQKQQQKQKTQMNAFAKLMQNAKESKFDLTGSKREAGNEKRKQRQAAETKAFNDMKRRRGNVADAGSLGVIPPEDAKEMAAGTYKDKEGKRLKRYKLAELDATTTFKTPKRFLPPKIRPEDIDTNKELILFVKTLDYTVEKRGDDKSGWKKPGGGGDDGGDGGGGEGSRKKWRKKKMDGDEDQDPELGAEDSDGQDGGSGSDDDSDDEKATETKAATSSAATSDGRLHDARYENLHETSNSVPVLRASCVTDKSEQVIVNIKGYRPYIYCTIPHDALSKYELPRFGNMTADHKKRSVDLADEFKAVLEQKLKTDRSLDSIGTCVLAVDVVDAESMMYYHANGGSPHFKITFAVPSLVNKVRSILSPSTFGSTSLATKGKPSSGSKSDPKASASASQTRFATGSGLQSGELMFLGKRRRFDVFDANIDFPLRFMIDKGTSGSSWMRLPPASFRVRKPRERRTAFDVEVETTHKNVEWLNNKEGPYTKIPNIRTLSFDIECAGKNGHFPKATSDPVVTIACVLSSPFEEFEKPAEKKETEKKEEKKAAPPKTEEEKKAEADAKEAEIQKQIAEGKLGRCRCCANGVFKVGPPPPPKPKKDDAKAKIKPSVEHAIIFTIGECDPIPGATVFSFGKDVGDPSSPGYFERLWNAVAALLRVFRKFTFDSSPDCITGYNVMNFDLIYLLILAYSMGLYEFAYLTKMMEPSTANEKLFTSSGTGTQKRTEIKMPGVDVLDMYRVMLSGEKLMSYQLNYVAEKYLKMNKADLHYSLLTPYTIGTPETRHKKATVADSSKRKMVAIYCLKDAQLPVRLMRVLKSYINWVQIVRITGVSMNIMINRGQSVKTASQMSREGLTYNPIRIKPWNPNANEEVANKSKKDKFQGATVIEPRAGYYENPVATLDFASLYPSIMMALNLCYTTLVNPLLKKEINPEHCKSHAVNPKDPHLFINPNIRKGMIPIILEALIKARKGAKAVMERCELEGDANGYDVADGQQKAIKISANSVYGYSTGGDMKAREIGETVTYNGRGLIDLAKRTVEREYSKANGHHFDCYVVYGDTDSIMVNCGPLSVEAARQFGHHMAERVNKEFPKGVKMEFEKIFCPYYSLKKKRYGGLKWEPEYGTCKGIDTKGGEDVRRDNCPYIRELMKDVWKALLENVDRNNVQASIDKAVRMTQEAVRKLMVGDVDLAKLVVTKSISKANYDMTPAHVYLARRMETREPGSAPGVGDRIQFLYIKAPKGALVRDRIEDPFHVIANNLPIDYPAYIEQLIKPMSRLLKIVVGRNLDHDENGKFTEYSNQQADDLMDKMFNDVLHNPDNTVKHTKISTTTKGSIGSFADISALCLRCKTPVPSKRDEATGKYVLDGAGRKISPAMCDSEECQAHALSVMTEHFSKVNRAEKRSAAIQATCQACQDDHHGPDLCSNKDCPLFYQRTTIRIYCQELDDISAREW